MNTINRFFLTLFLLVLFAVPAHADIADPDDEAANSMSTDFGGDRDPDCQ